MPWDHKAQDHVFELNLAGQPEKEIVRLVTRKYGVADKTVRRCFSGLCLIVAERDRVPDSRLRYLQQRATLLEVTEGYLLNLRHAYSMFLDRHSILPSVWHQHWMDLTAVVSSLRGTGVWSLADFDLAVWWSRINADRTWPIGGAKVTRASGNKMSVALDAEALPQWAMLQQHLPDDPMWRAAEAWKVSAARDAAARIGLLSAISRQIKASKQDQGLEFALVDDLLSAGAPDPGVSLRYAFDLQRGVLGGLVSSGEKVVEPGDFKQYESNPDIRYMDGIPMVKSAESKSRERGAEFFVRSQRTLRALPRARTARASWLRNRQLEDALHAQIERVAGLSGLPIGSRCDGCPIPVRR